MATFAHTAHVRYTLQVTLDEHERYEYKSWRGATEGVVAAVTFKSDGYADVTVHRVRKDGSLYKDGQRRFCAGDALPEWLQEQQRLYVDEAARLNKLVQDSLRPLPEGGA